MSGPFTRDEVQRTQEFTRIAAMPRREWTRAQIEELTDRMTALLKTPGGTKRLFPIQALALYELGTTGGILGPIHVGGGKELTCFLAPRVLFAKHPLLLMPAHLVKRSEDEMQEYAVHWRIPTNLRILSFQMLGQASRSEALGIVPPDLFVINEAHRLKNKNAAVTRRVIRHMAQFPNARVIAVSGTLLAHSLMDFAHIARWCVKPCPLPNSFTELKEWSDALDEKPSGWNAREPGALLDLCTPEELKHPPVQAARMGFRRRLTETAGVVATTGGDDVANAEGDPITLTVRALSYDQDPIVETHFKKLREEWATPSGWQFSIAMGVWRHARTLALGLHYEWHPEPEGGPEGPWCLARRAWKSFVRTAIKESRGDSVLDSELQVTNACLGRWKCLSCPAHGFGHREECTQCGTTAVAVAKGALDRTVLDAWLAIQPSYTPSSRAVWHDDAALIACQKWMTQPGIVFTDHTFFAEELSRRTGCRYFGAGGIDKTGLEIEKADPNTCTIASRVANSTGRNLQAWHRGLITSSPHNALEYEQLLGRFHRHGQKHDVTFDLLVGCRENWDGWMRSLDLARMTRDTLGAAQKLLIARTEDFASEYQMDLRPGFKWNRTTERS